VATGDLMAGALARARAHREADLADLIEELRIPSVSTLPERREDCLRNARWLRERFERMGMTSDIVDVLPGGLPVVTAEWNGASGRPHLTVYGHYDVQPPDPLEEWDSPAFEPRIRDGMLFALKCCCVAVLFCLVSGVEAVAHERSRSNHREQRTQNLRIKLVGVEQHRRREGNR